MLRRTPLAAISRINALCVVGTIRARRGDPDAWQVLDEALAVARPTAEVQRLGPVYAARAEAAWLEGNLIAAREAARAGYDIAFGSGEPWILSELACWRMRFGDLDTPPGFVVGPYAVELEGRWQDAAIDWRAHNCPYESALASLPGGERPLRDAIRTLTNLGATRAVDAIGRRVAV
jgi:hypothetical protein